MANSNRHAKRSHRAHNSASMAARHFRAKCCTSVSATKECRHLAYGKNWGQSLSEVFKAMLPSK